MESYDGSALSKPVAAKVMQSAVLATTPLSFCALLRKYQSLGCITSVVQDKRFVYAALDARPQPQQ